MPRRLVLTLITLGMAVALTATPVSAGGGSLSIGNAGTDGEMGGGFIFDGTNFVSWPSCQSGEGLTNEEFRFALEFPLSGLPAGAVVTGATLSLRTNTQLDPLAQGAQPTAIYGYAGDGAIAAADVAVTGTPVVFTPTTTANRESHDVTGLLTPGVVASGWAGFSVRRDSTGNDVINRWDCPTGLFTELYPILTIAYDLPNPPTPVASLADAATAAPSTSGPLATLGFALLLIGSLGALILVNAQGVIRRRG